jgi:ankyrin repeat protein
MEKRLYLLPLAALYALSFSPISYSAAPEQTNQKHSLMLPLFAGTAILLGALYKASTKPTDQEALIQACYKNDLRTVNSLLQKNVDLGCHAPYGESPLHIACKTSNPEIVKILVNGNANVHAQTHEGETPFYFAVRRDCKYPSDSSKKIMQILLDSKVDINELNGRALSTSLVCQRYGSTAAFLLRSGADYTLSVNELTAEEFIKQFGIFEFLDSSENDYTLSENGLTAEQLIKQVGNPGMLAALNKRKKDDKEKVSEELEGLFNEKHLVATTYGGLLAAFYGLPNPD